MHAAALQGVPVLISFGTWATWLHAYVPSFDRFIVDSGAFSEFNSGKAIEQDKYLAWADQWRGTADAIAALDDIRGNWRNGLARWLEAREWTFPTYHEADEPEALDAILAHDPSMIGLGGLPPRGRKTGDWLRETLPRIPASVRLHGWAMRGHIEHRWHSVDSTNWWLDTRKVLDACAWLTPAEAVEIVIKRYKRAKFLRPAEATCNQMRLLN